MRYFTLVYDYSGEGKPLLSDKAIECIAQCKHIEHIKLRGNWYSVAALKQLKSDLPTSAIDAPNSGAPVQENLTTKAGKRDITDIDDLNQSGTGTR